MAIDVDLFVSAGNECMGFKQYLKMLGMIIERNEVQMFAEI